MDMDAIPTCVSVDMEVPEVWLAKYQHRPL